MRNSKGNFLTIRLFTRPASYRLTTDTPFCPSGSHTIIKMQISLPRELYLPSGVLVDRGSDPPSPVKWQECIRYTMQSVRNSKMSKQWSGDSSV